MFSTGSTDIRRMSFPGGFLDHSDDWKDASHSPCGDDGAIWLWDLDSGEPLQMVFARITCFWRLFDWQDRWL
jgi:hypothetical protein